MRLIPSAVQYWREENHPDARYDVCLRKVQYRRPMIGGMVSAPGNILLYNSANGKPDTGEQLQWETVREVTIKAGTVSKLVAALINEEGELDGKLFNVFFNTYRTFSTPSEVLHLLLDMFHDASAGTCSRTPAVDAHHVRLTIRSIINAWIELFPEDFEEDTTSGESPIESILDFSAVNMEYFSETYEKASRLYSCIKREPHGLAGKAWIHRKHGLVSSYTSLDYATIDSQTDRSVDFISMNEGYIADQLTYWDADLFKLLIPYQCLGKFWNNRHKYKPPSKDLVYSVRATVNQFNNISTRVASMILEQSCEFKSNNARAKIIAKWIDVLRELRGLRNYSSVRAVLSALQCEPVYRLRTIWDLVAKSKSKEFAEISRNYSTEENSLGHQGFTDVDLRYPASGNSSPRAPKPGRRNRPYSRTKSDIFQMQGSVPYLGAFLTDLVHIDAACPSKTSDNLINFEKRRKEFQVLAQIKMFQSAAKGYHITCDPKFRSWFSKLPYYPESKWMDLSLMVQPTSPPAPRKKHSRSFGSLASLTQLVSELIPNGSGYDESCENLDQTSQDLSAYHGYDDISGSSCCITVTPPVEIHKERKPSWNSGAGSPFGVFHLSPIPGSKYDSEFDASAFLDWMRGNRKRSRDRHRHRWHSSRSWGNDSVHSTRTVPATSPRGSDDSNSLCPTRIPGYTAQSMQSLHGANSTVRSNADGTGLGHSYRKKSISSESSLSSSLVQSNSFDESTQNDCLLVQMSLDPDVQSQSPFLSLYKCVRLEPTDKTEGLIAKALAKHKIIGHPPDYSVVQVLPDGKHISLPPQANAYYALNQAIGGRKIQCLLKLKQKQSVSFSQNDLKIRKVSLPARLLRWNSTQ